LLKKDHNIVEQVFLKEKQINQLEIEIDDLGHSFLALEQPMAVDLRAITMILKINTDLERIADHAVNISERVLFIIEQPSWNIETFHLPEMAREVQEILKQAIDSFVHEDAVLAQSVLMRDDRVDSYNDSLHIQLEEMIQRNPSQSKIGMMLARIGHELERIADLANNIAEDVLYMKQGKEVRHHRT
jgi:phosphate transport system protein